MRLMVYVKEYLSEHQRIVHESSVKLVFYAIKLLL